MPQDFFHTKWTTGKSSAKRLCRTVDSIAKNVFLFTHKPSALKAMSARPPFGEHFLERVATWHER